MWYITTVVMYRGYKIVCSANYGPNYLSYTRGNCASCYIDCFRDTLFTAGSKKYFPTRTKRDQCMK